jgi:hypothetical protein
MTVRWIDGFTFYTTKTDITAREGIITTPGFANFATGRLGVGQCITTAQGYSFAPFASPQAALSIGFAYQVSNLSQAGTMLQMHNGGTPICDLRVTSTGALQATRDGNVLGTSAGGIIAPDVWKYLEVEVERSSSVGVFNVYVNGVSVLALTGQNTGGSNIDKITFSSGSADIKLDDLYVTDTSTRLGECRIDGIHPTADTATKAWTPSTGTDNYACVDEATFATSDFVSTSSAGDKDYYDMGALGFDPLTIHALLVLTMAKKDDATTRTLRSNLKSSATEGHGATKGLGSSFVVYTDIFTTDPNGSIPWTETSVNAAQVGIEVVS